MTGTVDRQSAPGGTTHEVAFVDTSVSGWDGIVRELAATRPAMDVVVLDHSDGLAQMAAWAATHEGYDAVHVIAHGAEGALQLGSTRLDADALKSGLVQTELKILGGALKGDGDLLLYGCDTAEGAAGAAFVGQLAAITGADVAASTDLTGASSAGGDWVLEAQTGAIEASTLSLIDFSGTLDLSHPTASISLTTDSSVQFGSAVGLAGDRVAFETHTSTPYSPGGSSTSDATISVYDADGSLAFQKNLSAIPGVTVPGNVEVSMLGLANGNIVVEYNSYSVDPTNYTRHGYFVILDPSGDLVTGPVQFNQTYGSSLTRFVSMDELSDGNFVIGYQQNNNQVSATRIYHADGTPVGNETVFSQGGNNPAYTIQVEKIASGYAQYTQFYQRNILQFFDNDGVQQGPAITLSNNSDQYYSLFELSDGNLLVTEYHSYGGGGSSAKLYDGTTHAVLDANVDIDGATGYGNLAVIRTAGDAGYVTESKNAPWQSAETTPSNYTGDANLLLTRHSNDGTQGTTEQADTGYGTVHVNSQYQYVDSDTTPIYRIVSGYAGGLIEVKVDPAENSNTYQSSISANLFEYSAAQTPTPTLTGLNPSLNVTGSGGAAAPVLIDGDVTFTDPNFGGGTIVVSGLLAEDRVALKTDGDVAVSGSTLSVGGTMVGTVSGGSGATFTITLNASATAATVDTLVQHLTYADAAATPTTNRTLSIVVTDASGLSTAPFSTTPDGSARFSGIGTGQGNTVAFGDLNGDNRVDMVVGQDDGTLKLYTQNADGSFSLAGSNPFANIDAGFYSAPALTDLNGDNRLDLVLGGNGTNLGDNPSLRTYLQNPDGTFSDAGAFAGIALRNLPLPTFGDFDGDGDADLVLGAQDGTLRTFRNDGGTFTELTGANNPFNGVDIGTISAATFGDFDRDGDLDLAVGSAQETSGQISAFRNNGDGTFSRLTGAANPFGGITEGDITSPQLIDIDGDGTLDLVVSGNTGGNADGVLRTYLGNPSDAFVAVTVVQAESHQAPTTSGSSATFLEDATYTFKAADFPFSDAGDSPADSLSAVIVTSLPGAGTLSYDGTAITAQQAAAGFSVAAADIGKLTYKPAADGNGSGYASFQFEVKDDGGTANGGSNTSAPATFTLNVTAVNDAPTATGLTQSLTLNEDAAATKLFTTAPTVNDTEGDTLTATLTLSDAAAGTLTGAGAGAGVAGAGTTTVYTITGTPAQVQSALAAVQFDSADNYSGTPSVAVVITDGNPSGTSGTEPSGTVSITVNPVNDPPTLSATGTNPTYTEGGAAVDLFSNVTVSTIESGQTLSGAVLTVSNVAGDGSDHLTFGGLDVPLNAASTSAGADGIFEVRTTNGTATVTFRPSQGGQYTEAQFKDLIDGITYYSTSQNPSAGPHVVTLTSLTDNGGTANGGQNTTSLSVSSSVTVAAVNDAPTAQNLDQRLTIAEDDPATLLFTTAPTVSDVDSNSLTATLVLASRSAGTLSGGGFTPTGAAGTYAFTGNAAQVQSALAAVKYDSADNISGANSVSVAISDGNPSGTTGTQPSGTVNITITAVNDDPSATGVPSDVTVTSGIASNVDLSPIQFRDLDSGSANVTFTIEASAGTLSAASGGSVTVSGAGTGTLTLTGVEGAIDNFLNDLSHIKYTSAANVFGDNAATLTLTANDGGHSGTGGGRDVALGTVQVDVKEAQSFVVTTLADTVDAYDGKTSLREAVAYANAHAGADTITFASNLTGTIRLDGGDGVGGNAGGTLSVTEALTIDGAGRITISGDVAHNDATRAGTDITNLTATDAENLADNVRLIDTASNLTLKGLTLTGGHTAGKGGAVNAASRTTVTIEGSTVAGNGATGDNGFGGGICGSDIVATGSTFSDNHAGAGGGGIIGGTVNLTNSTVSGNSSVAYGGGLSGVGVSLTNVTVTGNVTTGASGYGGGVYGEANTTLTNSIVLGNVAQAAVGDEISFDRYTSVGGNIIGRDGGGGADVFNGATDIGDTDAGAVFATTVDLGSGVRAGGLASNGGPVQTVALNASAANPAIDAADASAPATDARGTTRHDYAGVANGSGGTGADLGAFELQGTYPPEASNDSASVQQRSSVSGNVLTNDRHLDGDTLAVTSVRQGGADTAVSGSTVVQGTYGTLTLTADGSYGYSADVEGRVAVGNTVADTFTYTVSDGTGTAQANLAFTVTGSGQGDANDNIFLLTGAGHTATGDAGDDTYTVDGKNDHVVEVQDGGTDTVIALSSYTLDANTAVEVLKAAAGTGAINLIGNNLGQSIIGNDGANTLKGGSGEDLLDGGRGADRLIGGAGNDTYLVRDQGDTVSDASGTDTVKATIDYTLGAHVERLVLAGRGDIDGTGNAAANIVKGNVGDNHLDGAGGRDVLIGFGGADTFVFSTALGTSNVDRITDFDVDGRNDTIALDQGVFSALSFTGPSGTLDPGQFASIDGTLNQKYGDDVHLVYRSDKGALYYDADGYHGPSKAVLFAILDLKPDLASSDFHLA